MLFEYCLLGIALIVSFGFPLVMGLEFGERWDLHLKLYPHITLFPVLFLWVILLCFYQAVCSEKIIELINIGIFCSAVAILALYVDIRSGEFLMLFEISENASTTISPDALYDEFAKIEEIPFEDISISEKIDRLQDFLLDEILDQNYINIDKKSWEVDSLELNKQVIYNCINYLLKDTSNENSQELIIKNKEKCQTWLKFLLTYDLWKDVPKAFSLSRLLYGFTFFSLANVMLNSLALLVIAPIVSILDHLSIGAKYVIQAVQIKSIQRFPFLVGNALVFIGFWLPLRLYYNTRIKRLLFDTKKIIGGNVEQFIYIGILMFMLSLVYQVWMINKETNVLIIFLSILLVSSMSIVSIYQSKNNLIESSFGLKSNPFKWSIWIIVGGLTLFFLRFFPLRCLVER